MIKKGVFSGALEGAGTGYGVLCFSTALSDMRGASFSLGVGNLYGVRREAFLYSGTGLSGVWPGDFFL